MKNWTKKMKFAALAGVLAAGLTAFGGVADAAEAAADGYPAVEEVKAELG